MAPEATAVALVRNANSQVSHQGDWMRNSGNGAQPSVLKALQESESHSVKSLWERRYSLYSLYRVYSP